jgi:hypothetical protein
MELTKQSLQFIRKDIDAAFAEISKKYGINSMRVGNIKYNDSMFKFSCEAKLNAPENDKNLASELLLLGLPKDSYGRTFIHNGHKFKIVGCKLSKRKYPVIGQDLSSDKRFCFAVESIKF